jgi:hypothetical protein
MSQLATPESAVFGKSFFLLPLLLLLALMVQAVVVVSLVQLVAQVVARQVTQHFLIPLLMQ